MTNPPPPLPIVAPTTGVLLATRAPTLVTQGDWVACIAHDVEPSMQQ